MAPARQGPLRRWRRPRRREGLRERPAARPALHRGLRRARRWGAGPSSEALCDRHARGEKAVCGGGLVAGGPPRGEVRLRSRLRRRWRRRGREWKWKRLSSFLLVGSRRGGPRPPAGRRRRRLRRLRQRRRRHRRQRRQRRRRGRCCCYLFRRRRRRLPLSRGGRRLAAQARHAGDGSQRRRRRECQRRGGQRQRRRRQHLLFHPGPRLGRRRCCCCCCSRSSGYRVLEQERSSRSSGNVADSLSAAGEEELGASLCRPRPLGLGRRRRRRRRARARAWRPAPRALRLFARPLSRPGRDPGPPSPHRRLRRAGSEDGALLAGARARRGLAQKPRGVARCGRVLLELKEPAGGAASVREGSGLLRRGSRRGVGGAGPRVLPGRGRGRCRW